MPTYMEKQIGETPLDLVKRIKGTSKETHAFAGRLDPMARGQMIILKGIECKQMDAFCKQDKVYEFEILFGFQTDTYDILGIVESYQFTFPKPKINLISFSGKQIQPYPPYSSIIVNKKPLWMWAKEEKLSEINIPSKNIEIYSLEYLGESTFKHSEELLGKILAKINKLPLEKQADFRVPQIINRWKEVLGNQFDKPYFQKFRAHVSSGTYIRSLVHKIGQELGMGAIAWDINRTHFISSREN